MRNYTTWKNEDLFAEARNKNLDLDYETIKRGQLIQALKESDEDGDNFETARQKDVQGHVEFMKGRCKILLHTQEGDMGELPVYVGFNGKDYYIPRDQEVIVPQGVYNVLRNSREGLISTDKEGNVTQRNTQRFPFTVLEMGKEA